MSKKLINGNGGKKQNAEKYNEVFYQEYIKGNRLNNQSEFRKYVENNCIHKTNYDSYFVSQGLCHAGEYALTTSYYKKPDLSEFKDIIMSFGSIKAYAAENVENTNSRVDIHDKYGNNKTLYFEHDSHVGGIAYHEASGKFYVSNNGLINIYDEETIANAKHNEQITRSDKFAIAEEVKQSSYVAVHNDDFYVGKWERGKKDAYLAKYEIDPKTGKVSDEPELYNVPYTDIQGLEIYEKNGKEYYIFSSTDNFSEAKLHVAVLNDGKFESVGVLDVPGALEQISMNKDGKLGMVFESDCVAYNISSNPIGEIMYMDIDKAIDDMEVKKDKYIERFYKIYDKDKDGEVDNIDKWNKLFNGPETVSDYLSNAKNWIEETVQKGMLPVDKALNKYTDFDNDGISDLKEGIDLVNKKVDNILDFDNDGISDLKEGREMMKNFVKNGIDDLVEGSKNFFYDAKDALDVNDDGKINIKDVGSAVKFANKKVKNTLDVNNDGKVNTKDVGAACDSLAKKVNKALDFDGDGKNEIQEAGEWVADKAEKGAKAVYNKGKEIVDDIGDKAKDAWDTVCDWFD